MHFARLLTLLMALALRAEAAPVCAQRTEAAPALERLSAAMAGGRFVAYQPTSLRVTWGQLSLADPAGIEADLRVLRPHFDGLITYGVISGAERIPDLAAKLGFRAVILGIWDIHDPQQVANAVAAWQRHPELVVGVAVGNEVVFSGRATPQRLEDAMAVLRAAAPGLPLAISEPFHVFDDARAAQSLARADFLLPIVHPVFQPWFATAPAWNAADFVVRIVTGLEGLFCGPILVKETGVPTAPADAGYSAVRQAAFFAEMRRQFAPGPQRAFAYFSAFDAPWRVQDVNAVPGERPEEAWWGLYTEQREPKQAITELPPLPN